MLLMKPISKGTEDRWNIGNRMTHRSTQDYQGVRLHNTGLGANTAASIKPSIAGIWRLVQPLHNGTWCDLYAAQPADAAGSPRLDYAVKIARKSASDQPEVLRQLRAEVDVCGAARHPHLIPLLDSDLEGTRPFIVMPRLESRTMADAIRKASRQNAYQPIPVALWWVRQTAQALLAIHDSGWTHGDLKPENIMVDSRGHVTLIDLGFAKPIGTKGDDTFRGTPDFAAPEAVSGAASNPKSDIYSLGTVLSRLIPKASECPTTVTQLVEQMRAESVEARPTTKVLCELLLKLEIENLHLHLSPNNLFPKRAA